MHSTYPTHPVNCVYRNLLAVYVSWITTAISFWVASRYFLHLPVRVAFEFTAHFLACRWNRYQRIGVIGVIFEEPKFFVVI